MLERAIKLLSLRAGHIDKISESYILHPLSMMLVVREKGGTVEQQPRR